MLKIKTPSRIHMTLIDMNGSLGRVDGGIGITLEEPNIVITAKKSDSVEVRGDPELNQRMKKACEVVCPGCGIEIDIKKSYWNHIGLGSGTQAALAAGMAISALYDLNLSPRAIAGKVGRGGTSGIGIGSFERGGFILDGGHRMEAKSAFLPAHFQKACLPRLSCASEISRTGTSCWRYPSQRAHMTFMKRMCSLTSVLFRRTRSRSSVA